MYSACKCNIHPMLEIMFKHWEILCITDKRYGLFNT